MTKKYKKQTKTIEERTSIENYTGDIQTDVLSNESHNHLRRKRVQRDVDTTEIHTQDHEHINVHDSITSDVQKELLKDAHTNIPYSQSNTTVDESTEAKALANTNGERQNNTKPIKHKKTSAATANGKQAKPRQKRFLQLFRSNNIESNDNFIFRALNFLIKNRKSVVPIVSVVRDVSTLVKSAGGELNHNSRERNSYVGVAPDVTPLSYTLELGGENKALAFVKRLLGLSPKGDRLTIGG